MSGYVVTFDNSVSSTAVPELIVQTVERDLVPGIRDGYVDVPGLPGAVLFPEEDGDRAISMQCSLVADDGLARRAAVRNLAKWARKKTRKRLIVDNEPDRFWDAKLSDQSNVAEKVLLGQLTLVWRVGPYAQSIDTTSTLSASAASGDPTTVDVSGSDVEVEPVIEITSSSFNVAGFTVTIGGTVLTIGDDVSPFDEYTVSCVTQTVVTGLLADQEFADGTFAGGALNMANVTGAFGVLTPEDSDVVVTGIDATVRVVFRERYL